MILVDSNIIFSALIKDSLTRKIILESDSLFLFPEYAFNELENHMDYILLKTGMNKNDLSRLLRMILKKVRVIPDEIIAPYGNEAVEIIRDIDINDAVFIATALAYPGYIIWSNDKHLKKQSRIKVINTAEMMKEL